MVQIVGQDKQLVKRATCRNCTSMLEYTQSEVESRIHRDYGGGSDVIAFIRCPSCGKQVHVSRY